MKNGHENTESMDTNNWNLSPKVKCIVRNAVVNERWVIDMSTSII